MATIESELLNKNDFLMLTVYSLISAQVINPCTNRYLSCFLLDTENQEKNGNSINMVKRRRYLHQEFHLSKSRGQWKYCLFDLVCEFP